MKNLFNALKRINSILLLFLIFFINNSKAQIVYENYLSPESRMLHKYRSDANNPEIFVGSQLFPNGNAYVGKQEDAEPGIQNTFRMIYSFSLSGIPNNAIISKVNLIFYPTITRNNGASVIQLLLKGLANNGLSGLDQSLWSNVTSGSLLSTLSFAIPGTSDVMFEFSQNSEMTNHVINHLADGKVLIGLASTDENWTQGFPSILVADFKNSSQSPLQGVKLKITYTVPQITITPDNNFVALDGSHGIINVNNVPRITPYYTHSAVNGTNVTLEALNNQYDALGYEMVWNDFPEFPINRSTWNRIIGTIVVPISNNRLFNFTLTPSDNNSIYQAQMRFYFNLQIDKTLPESNYILQEGAGKVIEQNSKSISAPVSITDPQNNNYVFSYWQETGNGNNPLTVTPTNHTTYNAVYKAVNASNKDSALYLNGSRKICRTPAQLGIETGLLHKVYESDNKIWYEVSTDNGATWQFINNNRPISTIGLQSLSPAISYNNGNENGAYTVVTYFQE